MGILLSKTVKKKENPLNEEVKNGTTKTEIDLEQDNENYFTENPNNTLNTSEGLGPSQHIINQKEPNDNEVTLTGMHQVSAAEGPENRDESSHKATNTSRNADLLKHVPYLPSNVKVNETAETFEALSDILQQLYDVSEKIKHQHFRPPRQLPQMTKPTVLIQREANKQVIDGHIQPEESRNFTQSPQKPAANEATKVILHNSEVSTSAQLPAQMFCTDIFPQVECRVTVRPAGNQPTKEADAETKAKPTKLSSQQSNCGVSKVNNSGTDLISHTTEKAHNIVQQSTITNPDVAEASAATSTGPAEHSTQMSNEPKAQLSNKENAQQEFCLNHITNMISVAGFSYKSEKRHTNTKVRQWQKKRMAQQAESRKSIRETVGNSVITYTESSQQQGYSAVKDKTVKKHSQAPIIPQPNQADCGKTSSCNLQTVSVEVKAHVPVVERRPIAVLNNANAHNSAVATDTDVRLRVRCEPKVSLPQDTAVRPKIKCTQKDFKTNQTQLMENTEASTTKKIKGINDQIKEQEQDVMPQVIPEHKACARGRWNQFKINQSCSYKARCKHNPGKGLPPNVQKWSDDCPNYEPPWVTTARLAACLALRGMQDENGDSQE